MKILLAVSLQILAISASWATGPASSQASNPCKVYHDRCIAKGVLRGGGRVHACEVKEAQAAKDQACLNFRQSRDKLKSSNSTQR